MAAVQQLQQLQATLQEIVSSFSASYVKTPAKLKILDAFSVCALATAALLVRRLQLLLPADGGLCWVRLRDQPRTGRRWDTGRRLPARPASLPGPPSWPPPTPNPAVDTMPASCCPAGRSVPACF